MEELDIDGLFWLATNPDNKVAGRLKFDSASGAELDLIGALLGIPSDGIVTPEVTCDDKRRPRIQGVAGRRQITLDRCLRVEQNLEFPGIHREKYSAPIVITGHYFGEDDLLEFSSVLVSLRHLEYWVNKSGVEVEYISEDGLNHIKQIHLTHTPVDRLATTTNIGDLELCFGWKLKGDHVVQSTIEQSCGFYLRFSEARSLEDTQKTCSALKELVAIGLNTPSSITEITLELPKKALNKGLPNCFSDYQELQ